MSDIEPGFKSYNLVVKVVEIKVVVECEYEGITTKIAECIVGDETGIITFSAKNGKNIS